ncbi:hypothetical protein BKA00_007612 [Actinomadura coerulea]|uniref:Uncharacterized protein n=1 Tax=Actinomadura coerulea TaxID=46159 RepID=A0A7X0L3G1_9ACTN|nr:hypothetical protein [Actinomadura coerulea]MBB6400698.1 hypothetical protein [Actinomadura coerulea]GGQ09125.1 hypothetical protein GCM10010187_26670 [Actinomadura coerulea]
MKKAGLTLAGVAVLGTAAVVGTTWASGGDARSTTSVAAKKEFGAQPGTGSAQKKGQKCTDKRVARGKRHFAGTWTRWENQDPWTVSGWGPGTMNAATSYTVGHTVTISYGATAESINATLGYQANKQWQRSLGYTPTLPEKKHYRLDIGRVYKIYQFDVYEPTGTWMADLSGMGRSQCVGLRDVYVGKGKALYFWKLDHRLSVTPKKKR